MLVAALGVSVASYGGGASIGEGGAIGETSIAYGVNPIAYHNDFWLEGPDFEQPEPIGAGQPRASNRDDELAALTARLAELELKYTELESMQSDFASNIEGLTRPLSNGTTLRTLGRMHVDYWGFPASSPGINGFETGDNNLSPQDEIGFRRLRFGIRGTIWKTMVYEVDLEFADANNAEFRDAYFGFDEVPWLQKVLIGNQKRPYGLDYLNSSNYNVFMERPFAIEAFNRDVRRAGIQSWNFSDDLAWNWRYGFFNQGQIQGTGIYVSDHWQGQVAGRLANTIWYDECSDGRGYAHWAIAGTWANTDGNANSLNYAASGLNTARFATRPEARSFSLWLDTGLIEGADNYTLLGLENVVNVGAWQWVGEYQHVWLQRDDASELEFSGGYFYLSYFLTGEHIPWHRETGTIDRVIPFENFFLVDTCGDGVRGGWGAWQIAARFSAVDLSDNDIQGGIGRSFTAALNWHWNPWARMQVNYLYGDIYDNAFNAVGGIDFGNYQIVGARFMVDF